jgi:hypothetical protein
LLGLYEKGDERGEGGEHGRGTEFHDRRLYSGMAGDCCGGRFSILSVATQFVTMVMGVFARWSSGDPAAWYPEEA